MAFKDTITVTTPNHGSPTKITLSDTIDVPDYLVMSSRGFGRTGKSHFGATMPETIGWLPLDPNARWTAHRLQQSGVNIIMPTSDFGRIEDPEKVAGMEAEACKAYYWDHIRIVRAIYTRYLEMPKIKSIVVDTGGQLFEDIMYAHYGRKTTGTTVAYGAPRQTLKDFFIAPVNKNVLFVHHARPRYVDNVKTSESDTDGCSKLPDWVNCEVEHFYMASKDEANQMYVRMGGKHPDNKDKAKWTANTFGVRIMNATMNMNLVGKCFLGEECNFGAVMADISPDLYAKYY